MRRNNRTNKLHNNDANADNKWKINSMKTEEIGKHGKASVEKKHKNHPLFCLVILHNLNVLEKCFFDKSSLQAFHGI